MNPPNLPNEFFIFFFGASANTFIDKTRWLKEKIGVYNFSDKHFGEATSKGSDFLLVPNEETTPADLVMFLETRKTTNERCLQDSLDPSFFLLHYP